jgi:hypothetical protein
MTFTTNAQQNHSFLQYVFVLTERIELVIIFFTSITFQAINSFAKKKRFSPSVYHLFITVYAHLQVKSN